jgi:penicillin-binding protein 1A
MERYFNHVYFGHGYYGVRTAAEGYFRKNLAELSLKEIAMLVGIPKQPSSYDPTRHLNLSYARANSVLERMRVLGWIGEDEYTRSTDEQPHVYNDTLSKNQAPYAVDEAIRIMQNQLGYDDVRSGGYRVGLSIDLKAQKMAQNALQYGWEQIIARDNTTNTSNLNGAIVVLDNHNGDVLALVGGHNYSQSNFNRAVFSQRQLGSSFKPFLYQIALDNGYGTMDVIPDISRVYAAENESEKDWIPKNIGENFKGLMSLKDALVSSSNLATINLVNSIGLDTVVRELAKMGFKNIPRDASLALGSLGLSPLEYSKYFGMFANNGVKVDPILIRKITNRFGDTVAFETKSEEVLDPAQNYLMLDLMKSVVSGGTGRAARVDGIEIAGKTGTSNDNVDAWFCGITPDINVMIWYGNDDNTPMARTEVGGRTSAAPFAHFVRNYIKTFPETKRKFAIPGGVNQATYNGQQVYFTAKSPLPSGSRVPQSDDGGLMF